MYDFKIKQKIISFFDRNRDKFVSGEAMSRELGFSRAYLWKYINRLREEGYEIEALPHSGYKLKKKPDKVYGYELSSKINEGSFSGKNIYYYESIDSTNDRAYELAEAGEPEGTIVVAEKQISGKGRMGRKWVSPEGVGLYFSIILRPELRPDEIPAITMVSGMAVVDAVKKNTRLAAKIKWPNDVFISGKKVAGILAEMKAQPDNVEFLVLGMGININTPLNKLPEGSTSLRLEGLKCFDRTEFLAVLLNELEVYYKNFREKGFNALRERCKNMSNVIGKKIRINDHGESIKGTAVDIDPTGSLILKKDDGEEKKIFSGDVILAH